MKAGFAKLEITSPLGSNLNGYFTVRPAQDIIEPLYANALAFSDGENTALAISLDISEIIQKDTDDIRSRVSAATGVPFEAVFVACIHTHTAPVISEIGGFFKRDPNYYDFFCKKICDCAVLAIRDMTDAIPSIARTKAEGISFVRRFITKDGVTVTNPSSKIIENIAGPIGKPDETVQLVKFERPGASDIAVVNFQTHPDVLGGNKICPDWPCYVRNTLENALSDVADGKGVKVIFFNGAQGDVAHNDRLHGIIRRGPEHSRHMGRAIAGAVMGVYTYTEPVSDDKVFFKQNMTKAALCKGTDEQVAIAKEIDKKFLAGEDISDCKFSITLTRKYLRNENEPPIVDLNIVCIGFGDVVFVGLPGEPFTTIGVQIKENSPFKMTIPCCNANGSAGYFPTDDALTSSGYESASSPFLPGIANNVIETSLRTLNELNEELKKSE